MLNSWFNLSPSSVVLYFTITNAAKKSFEIALFVRSTDSLSQNREITSTRAIVFNPLVLSISVMSRIEDQKARHNCQIIRARQIITRRDNSSHVSNRATPLILTKDFTILESERRRIYGVLSLQNFEINGRVLLTRDTAIRPVRCCWRRFFFHGIFAPLVPTTCLAELAHCRKMRRFFFFVSEEGKTREKIFIV